MGHEENVKRQNRACSGVEVWFEPESGTVPTSYNSRDADRKFFHDIMEGVRKCAYAGSTGSGSELRLTFYCRCKRETRVTVFGIRACTGIRCWHSRRVTVSVRAVECYCGTCVVVYPNPVNVSPHVRVRVYFRVGVWGSWKFYFSSTISGNP